MIDPGRLKTRLVIEAPDEADDGQGGVARAFTTVATVWAAVMPLAARGRVEADAGGAVIKVRIILRSNFALTLQHRLVDGAKVYRITALRDRDDRRFIEVDAELRVE
jgi:SPP1 family predicted phage head-tail adaptor